jgi:uncharacterized membrane protein
VSVLDSPGGVRRAIAGLTLVSGLGLGVLTAVQRPLVGVAVYAVAMVGVFALHWRSDATLYDERDEAIAQEAASLTLTVFGWASAGVFPALTAAWGLGYFEWGPASAAVALFVAALYATYGGFLFVVGKRR